MDEIILLVRTPPSQPPAQAVKDVPCEISDADVPQPRWRERAAWYPWYPQCTGRQAAVLVFISMVIYTMLVAAITTTWILHLTHTVGAGCRENSCCHGATFVEDKHMKNGYNCSCAGDYEGEVDKDECAASPCAHGGTCLDGTSNYTCLCQLGFEGENCQTAAHMNLLTMPGITAAPRNLLTMPGITCSSSQHKTYGGLTWSCDKAYDGETSGTSGGWATESLRSANGQWIQINFPRLVTLTSLDMWPLCKLWDQYGRWNIRTADNRPFRVRTGCNGTSYYTLCATVPMQTLSLPSLETTYIRLTGREDCGGRRASSNGVRELEIHGF